MQIQIFGVMEYQPGDSIEILDELRPGDIVMFDRLGPNRLGVRRLSDPAASSFRGHRYRIDGGDRPDSIMITLIEDQPVVMWPKRWWKFWK